MSALKRYLGDSVYADVERGMVKLTTENGYEPSNTIYLEAQVLEALVAYVEMLGAKEVAALVAAEEGQ